LRALRDMAQTLKRGKGIWIMRMDVAGGLIRPDGQFLLPRLFQKRAQTIERGVMARLKRQSMLQIRKRRTQQAGAGARDRAHMPSFGKFRRMIDQRAKMIPRRSKVSGLKRVLSASEQEIHCGRSRFRQFKRDILGNRGRGGLIGLLQLRKQTIQPGRLTRPCG